MQMLDGAWPVRVGSDAARHKGHGPPPKKNTPSIVGHSIFIRQRVWETNRIDARFLGAYQAPVYQNRWCDWVVCSTQSEMRLPPGPTQGYNPFLAFLALPSAPGPCQSRSPVYKARSGQVKVRIVSLPGLKSTWGRSLDWTSALPRRQIQ